MSHLTLHRKRSADLCSNRHRRRPLVEELEPRTLLAAAVYYNPIQLATAYGFPAVSSTTPYPGTAPYAGYGETIAIVDAYNDPTITNDVNTFDSPTLGANTPYGTWQGGPGIPAFGSQGAGSFAIENQTGGTIKNQTSTRNTTPAYNSSWDLEIALDVEWSHATAPGANIILVEANSSSTSDLLAAVKTAASQAQVVSMSWGSNEFSGETADDATFAAFAGTGVTFVASSGDTGVVSWPAVSPDVVGVGGTILNLTYATGAYGSETAWSDSGGGVSKYESIPTYQKAYQTIFGTSNGASSAKRNSPDVAYDSGSSNNFVWVYDAGGWYGVYGTSAGAPQWSALIATADQGLASATSGPYAPLDLTQTLPGLYQSSADFNDITTGKTSGHSAGSGYDLVTGLGSPKASNVIGDLIIYAEANPASSTPFTSAGNGGSAGPGNPSGIALNISGMAGARTPINNTPGSPPASLFVSNPVQKLTALPFEVMPAATATGFVNGSLAIAGVPTPDGSVHPAASVQSNGRNWTAGVVAGLHNNTSNDRGTMLPASLTTGALSGSLWTAWPITSSALSTNTAAWGLNTAFDTAGWPMLPPMRAEDTSNALPEEKSIPLAAAFAVLGMMTWSASWHANGEEKKNSGIVLR